MLKKHKYATRLFSLLFILLLTQCFPAVCHAEIPRVRIESGQIIFKTHDTTATNSTTWGTVGFTVTREKCRSGPTKNAEGNPWALDAYAPLYITDDMKKPDPNGSVTEVAFTIPEKIVNKALSGDGFADIKENDKLFLHTIFQVYHEGKKYGKQIHSYDAIRNAEGWVNKDDFGDRFDIPVEYHANKQKVTVLSIDGSGKEIKEKELTEVVPGEKTEYTFPIKVSYNGKDLYLCKTYVIKNSTGKRVKGSTHWVTSVTSKTYDSQVEAIKHVVQNQLVGGITYVGRYVEKRKGTGKDVPITDPYPTGVIAADERNNEYYDVIDGIPTSEQLYTNVFTSKYLLGYNFVQVMGKKSYVIPVSKTYNMHWEEVDPKTMKKVSKSDSKTVTQSVNIYRYYSYWYIKNLEYFKIDNAKVNNYSLPGGSAIMNPVGYTIPELSYVHSIEEGSHIKEPNIPSSITLPSESVDGQSVPGEDFTGAADSQVAEIKVRNDKMEFDGTVIMDNNYVNRDTIEPLEVEIDYDDIEEDVLFKPNQMIESSKSNGTFETTGTVTYTPVKTIEPRITMSPNYSVNELNKVVIHTPTVCDAFISDQKSYNQMLNPDLTRDPLVLDTSFTIMLPTTGSHRYINGYGYNDYAKYIDRQQVKFPFDVYRGTTYIPTGSWTTLSSETTQFYLPIWVNEGNYTIDFRSISINADANQAINQTETLANLSLQNYVATDTINVQVSGRIYNLKLYDISDYPIWQDVFRKPNSLKLTGFQYTVGTKNQNGSDTGQNAKYTIPLVNGSHPTRLDIGAIKSGYVTRFHLVTIGNMFSDKDYIKIRPRFYYVDAKVNKKQEVDIYYTETFLGKKQVLIRAGSLLDLLNVKTFHLGDTYLSVPEAEITTKSYVTGKSVNEIKDKKANLFTFTNIMIPEALRTYTGTNYTPTGSVPNGVDERKVTSSMQKWYAEYYLPSDIHVVLKGYDVEGYSKNNGGLDYQETFWLKDGYVIVNFDIETIQNGVRHLSYLNLENAAKGYCNMWNREGFLYGKVDEKGNQFQFVDGDTFLYFTDKSAARDYRAGGTH